MEFLSLRKKYQLMHGRAYDKYRVGIEKAINSDPRVFFGNVNLKKKRIGQLCILKVLWHLALAKFVIFLLILYNEHKLMMYGCFLILDKISYMDGWIKKGGATPDRSRTPARRPLFEPNVIS
jgi:hypothetical protein